MILTLLFRKEKGPRMSILYFITVYVDIDAFNPERVKDSNKQSLLKVVNDDIDSSI